MTGSNVFEEGYDTYWDGVAVSDNPYNEDSENRRAWEAGWRPARNHNYDETQVYARPHRYGPTLHEMAVNGREWSAWCLPPCARIDAKGLAPNLLDAHIQVGKTTAALRREDGPRRSPASWLCRCRSWQQRIEKVADEGRINAPSAASVTPLLWRPVRPRPGVNTRGSLHYNPPTREFHGASG
jgi:hypothetical protein